MFRRRNPKTYLEAATHAVWPPGGWKRAAIYVAHRLSRLPDPADKIARGIAAGVFVCFTPFFGVHFLIAVALAWAMRGNVIAALLATFFGNPITFPIIATISVELGTWLIGLPPVPLPRIVSAFSYASLELWSNFSALFTGAPVHWDRLADFFAEVFLPYLVGGLAPGVIAGLVAYLVSRPLISAYQRGRIKRLKRRFEKQQAALAHGGAHGGRKPEPAPERE